MKGIPKEMLQKNLANGMISEGNENWGGTLHQSAAKNKSTSGSDIEMIATVQIYIQNEWQVT